MTGVDSYTALAMLGIVLFFSWYCLGFIKESKKLLRDLQDLVSKMPPKKERFGEDELD